MKKKHARSSDTAGPYIDFFFKTPEYVAYFLGVQFATNSLGLQLSIQITIINTNSAVYSCHVR